MNACEMFYGPFKSVLQMVQMLRMIVNAFVNHMNVLRIKQDTKYTLRVFLFVLYLPASVQSAYFPFKFVLIVHIHPAFYRNVNMNVSEHLQTCNDNYKCLANNKNGLQLVKNMLQMVTNMLGIYFPNEF